MARRAALGFLAALGAVLTLGAAPSAAQCEGVAGAGDEYCETLPGAGGDRTAARGTSRDRGRTIAPSTGRELDRAGAGAIRKIDGPGTARGTAPRGSEAPAQDAGGPDESILPYLLAALTAVLLLGAVARLRRGSTSPQDAS